VADVVGRGLRRIVVQRDAAGLLLELRDRGLVGLGRGGKLPEYRAAALLAFHGRRHSLLVKMLVTARQANQGDDTDRTTVLHDVLENGSSPSWCKSYAGAGESGRTLSAGAGRL